MSLMVEMSATARARTHTPKPSAFTRCSALGAAGLVHTAAAGARNCGSTVHHRQPNRVGAPAGGDQSHSEDEPAPERDCGSCGPPRAAPPPVAAQAHTPAVSASARAPLLASTQSAAALAL